MSQHPNNPATPYAESASGDYISAAMLPQVVQSTNSCGTTETMHKPVGASDAPSAEVSGTGAAIEADTDKKRNKSFKITGILPSRPPSNSDEDDVDDSTVTEDDIPDSASIHPADGTNEVNRVAPPVSAGLDIDNPAAMVPKHPQTILPENKQPSQQQNTNTSMVVPTTNLSAGPAAQDNSGQRRNSSAQSGGKGSGVSGMLSVRTAMVGMAGVGVGYRFNIFVYDNKLGKSNQGRSNNDLSGCK